jgi:hypothetical protein
MRPLAPNVQSSVDGMYFGGTLSLWPTAARLDTSPAWLSWVGARSALALLSTLDAQQVEEHCLDLANQFRVAARDLGYPVLDPHGCSQIVTVEVPNPGKLTVSLRDHRPQDVTCPGPQSRTLAPIAALWMNADKGGPAAPAVHPITNGSKRRAAPRRFGLLREMWRRLVEYFSSERQKRREPMLPEKDAIAGDRRGRAGHDRGSALADLGRHLPGAGTASWPATWSSS